ncbi:twin transmembrane helix small protein [Phenylobacterium sp. LH3H17]|uniref:twin transmembrane helix small protein n=1 Tax=Phenylobacterium sp. LH3H17 TaxID=2903901 RepID=UPI0020C95CA8|nr:twin transmembrane helix small protein [Phenylobacterium sp. LH3H17]UTP39357.1 twin transmembrane helix small protein [Phenylobacterium sp. LH3H17]
MNTFFQYLIPISLVAVTVTLFIGLYALFRGGDFGRSYSNKLMRLRVLLQAVAVAVLVAAVWWRHNAGG